MGSLWENGVTRPDFIYVVKRSLRLFHAAQVVENKSGCGESREASEGRHSNPVPLSSNLLSLH